MVETGFKHRDALRLLFILQAGSSVLASPDPRTGAARIFEGEKRLFAIDFWVRYPDYLADELLDFYEAKGGGDLLAAVDSIFDSEEPSVRTVKMLRWKRGAYDLIEDALSVLSSRQLVVAVEKILPTGIRQHDFLVLPAAKAFLDEAVADQPILAWYRDRAALAMRVAEFKSGTVLKDTQYEDEEYKNTPFLAYIPGIAPRVRERLLRIKSKAA